MQQQQHRRGGVSLPPLNCLDDMMAGIDFSMPESFFNDEDDDDFCFTTAPVVVPTPSPPQLQSQPAAKQNAPATMVVEMNNNNNNNITSDQQQQQQQNAHDGLFVASLPITDADSVNLYMFFDSIQQAVVCPRQTITFQTGSVVSTAIVGPMVIQQSQLESLFHSAKNLSSAHLNGNCNALLSSSSQSGPPMTTNA